MPALSSIRGVAAETLYITMLQVLPLFSGICWLGIGLWPVVRSRLFSPFERSLTAFALLLGVWSVLDGIFLRTVPGQESFALVVSNIRITVITAATTALLLAAKWISFGHSRYDALLVLPALGSFLIIWTGLTSGVEYVWWGPRVVRDPFRYVLWASQQLAFVAASLVITAALYSQRKDLPRVFRHRIFWTVGSLFVFLLIWLSTNIYNNVTQTAGVPWLSSLLFIPAALILISFAPMSSEDLGELLRAVSAADRRVAAVYLFHGSGDPLVALASDRTFPIEAERIQTILSAVGGFVEKSIPASQGYGVTGMRFDEQGVVAVRGHYVIAAALYDGPVYDVVRSELIRLVRSFEERHGAKLGTFEEASKLAERAADELAMLLRRPDRAMPGMTLPGS